MRSLDLLVAASAAVTSVSATSPFHHRRSREVTKRAGTNVIDASQLNDSYDFVIAGGGLAGLAVAGRLAEDPSVTVLVLEAGMSGDDVADNINIPGYTYWHSLWGSDYDWSFATTAQDGLDNKPRTWPRGKVFGGSSATNGMYFTRPNKEEIDAWSTLLGDDSYADYWTWDSFYAASKKSETFHAPTDEAEAVAHITYDASLHGTDGPIHTTYPAVSFGFNGNWTDTCVAAGIPPTTDALGGDNLGAGITTSSINPETWTRSYSRSGYIDAVGSLANLHLLPQAHVTKINFNGSTTEGLTASGVTFQASADSAPATVTANKEVILTGGVVGSPHILLLSGVGPKDVLDSVGIEVQHELPGVGLHLQDHVSTAVQWTTSIETAGTVNASGSEYAKSTEFLSYINSANAYVNLTLIAGEAATQNLTATAATYLDTYMDFVPSSDETVKVGYKAIHDLTVDFMAGWVSQLEILLSVTTDGALIIQAGLQHPLSTGHLYLSSSDPFTQPAIDPGYLNHWADMFILREGVKLARAIGNTEPLSQFLSEEQYPGSAVQTDEDWENYLRTSASTEFHPVGSCGMMPLANGGVVDGSLKVYGLANVRVADSSVIPFELSSHIGSPTYAVAELAAQIIAKDHSTTQANATDASSSSSSASQNNATTGDDTKNGARSLSLPLSVAGLASAMFACRLFL
ncbi:GMC oxidoreductase [Schizophyllum amplum]|uniref:GMC oxidoreductase n=1 Tax=Schizophyllum amplum TaxID=97359 RepID=A0A550C203_9AGAR|nr:GMC oxidoreductase [Auriculariopsis ampla]